MISDTDTSFMRMALNLARRGLGFVAPNPAVGCVLVKDEVVIARGWTAPGGRPHAEVVALAHAGMMARGASAYVSLEPCSHHGQTGPCAQALIDAGVRRVVVACTDPDPRVSGRGLQMLRDAGLEVVEGVLQEEALTLNAGFILRVTQGRPFVTLKCAVSADGKIAVAPGERTQISGPLATRFMHLQRSLHDAILIGSETYLTDHPRLTTRVQGLVHDPLRIVLDRSGRVGETDGLEVLGDQDIASVLGYLAERGVTRLLVEGGARIHEAFLESGCVDAFQLCKSPVVLGRKGVDGVKEARLTDEFGLKLQKTRVLGEDLLEIYGRSD